MSGRSLARLVGRSVARSRRAFVLSVLGVAVGIASLAFFIALSLGVRASVLERVFPSGQLDVVPRMDQGGGALSVLALGGPRGITDGDVDKLKAHPAVAAVERRLKIAFGARLSGGRQIIGRDLHGELIAEGIESLAEPASSGAACTRDEECSGGEYCADGARCEQPTPALISPFVIELYNSSIASSHGLPRLTSFLIDRLRGFTVQAELGRSMIGVPSQLPPKVRRIALAGVDARAAQLALSVPYATVQRWNAEFAGPKSATAPSSLRLTLRPGADAARLAADVRALGLAVSDNGAERAGLAILLITLLFALISSAILLLAGINIAHSQYRTVAERRFEISVMRAVGASAGEVRALVLAEAALTGAVAGAVGIFFARAGAFLLDTLARSSLPDFPFRPESYFAFPPTIYLAALVFGVVTAILGALGPAFSAGKLS